MGSLTVFEKDALKLREKFPKLACIKSRKLKCWVLTGELDICDTSGSYCGSFDIRIFVPESYPYCVPVVREISTIIPRNDDWHIDQKGYCCLDIDHKLLQLSRRGINISDFVREKVYPYFANQLYKIRQHRYAGEEYAHHFDGIVQYYQEDVHLSVRQAIIFLERLIQGKQISRNEPCPCGAAKKFKHCHWEKIQTLKWVGKRRLQKDLAGFQKMVISK